MSARVKRALGGSATMQARLTRFLLASASTLALACAASAADKPVTKAPPVVANWTGPYAGINLGAAWHEAEFRELSPLPVFFPGLPPQSLSQTAFTGGIQTGYNWQNQSYVYGIEADINWVAGSERGGGFALGIGSSTFTKIDWLATLRARAGFVINPLFYITGGLAIASIENEWLTVGGTPTGFVSDKTRVGYVVGAGAEHMYAANRTVRLEVLYLDFGKHVVNPPLFGQLHYRSEFRNTAIIARAAFNLKW
jgi:outer membrane immunogenic protein